MRVLKWTVLVLFVGLFAASSALAGPLRYTKGKYAACISEQAYDNFISYAVAKDTAAMQQMLARKLCIMLKAGIPVYIEDTTWSGKAKIRPKGQTFTLWTAIEEVR